MAQSRKDDSSKVWKIVNSGLFLWFLSTIVIGSGAYLFKEWDKEKTIYLSNQKTIKELDIEISSRLQYFLEQIMAGDSSKKAILVLENPTKSEFPTGVFPQYSNRPIRALLWELQSLVPESEKEEIKKALSAANNFKKIYLATLINPDVVKSAIEDIIKNAVANAKAELQKKSTPITKNTKSLKTKEQKLSMDTGKELSDHSIKLETFEGVTEKKLPGKDFLEKPEMVTLENKETFPELAPIHMTVITPDTSKINKIVEDKNDILKHTFDSFNLKRWGVPLKGLKMNANIKAK